MWEKLFWEENGKIKEINIYIRKFKDNKCSFEKLPMETVEIIMAAGKEMTEEASSAVKKASKDVAAASKKVATVK